MEIPSFCYDPNDDVTPCPILFPNKKSEVLIFIRSSTSHFLPESWDLLPHGEVKQQNFIYFLN